METLSFRAATEVDIPVITWLADKIWREHYPGIISHQQIDFMLQSRYSADVTRQQMQQGERYFLAYLDKDPVGYASIESKETFTYLHKFYLDVQRHRGGIGKQFFNFLLQQIDHTKPVKLQVNRQNYKAINFYFKMGFVIEQVGDFDIGGGYFMNDYVMIRTG